MFFLLHTDCCGHLQFQGRNRPLWMGSPLEIANKETISGWISCYQNGLSKIAILSQTF